MEIGRKFNILTKEEYFFLIAHHAQYSDFNTLGLYRSLLENATLSVPDKIEVLEEAHRFFKKTFDFLQLKDPDTFSKVTYLGEELTKGEEQKIWNDIKSNQQKILADKKIKHRNFGVYSKHHCGYEWCVYNGLMIRKGSPLETGKIHFDTDQRSYSAKIKSEKFRKERREAQNNIRKMMGEE